MAEGANKMEEEEVDGGVSSLLKKHQDYCCHGHLRFTEKVLFDGTFGGECVRYYECFDPHDSNTHAYIKLKDKMTSAASKELKWLLKLKKAETDCHFFQFAHILGFHCHRSSHCMIFQAVSCKLSDYLRNSELDLTHRHQLCEHICSGLYFLHSFSPCIIHCALTPESVLVCAGGTARLCDLSRAHYLQDGSRGRSVKERIRKLISKFHLKKWEAITSQNLHAERFTDVEKLYLSPEWKSMTVDDKHDVFSLGVVIMEVLTGNSPTPRGKFGQDEIRHRRSHDVKALRQTHPSAAEVVVGYCLRQHPSDRSPVDEVLQQLQSARRESAVGVSASPPAESHPPFSGGEERKEEVEEKCTGRPVQPMEGEDIPWTQPSHPVWSPYIALEEEVPPATPTDPKEIFRKEAPLPRRTDSVESDSETLKYSCKLSVAEPTPSSPLSRTRKAIMSFASSHANAVTPKSASPLPAEEIPGLPSSLPDESPPRPPSPLPHVKPPRPPSPLPHVKPPRPPSPLPHVKPPRPPSPLPHVKPPRLPSPSSDAEKPRQTVKYSLEKCLKPYDCAGFYRDIHYSKVEEVGGADVCVLHDTLTEHFTLELLVDVQEEIFFARELRLNGGGLPEAVVQRCDTLHKNENAHDNVAAFLGLIVEEHIHPHTYSMATIFEEYAEVNMMDFFHYKSEWKADADLFVHLWPDDYFRLVVRWAYQLFSALSYLHQQGITHKRLYGNCVRMHRRASYAVVEDFEVKVSCFLGNSDIPEEDKCRYKPPEAWERGGELWLSDVWSATCNVVLMVTSQHPWEGLPADEVPYKVHDLVNTSFSDNGSAIMSDLIHETLLEEELHLYQLKAITSLFKRVFLTAARNRPEARTIVNCFFHVCPGNFDMGQESVMLVVSEPPKFGDIPPSPIETWHISCCLCSPTRQHNDSVVVDSDLPKTLARRGIYLHASASLVLYGSLSQQEEGRPVGPAVFFHSPVPLESYAIRLRVPVDGMKSPCDNCRVLPFIGTYDQNSSSYMFQSRQSKALIYYDCNKRSDPRHLVIAVKDTVIFRPSCISGPSPCCPSFEYQVCVYRSNPTQAMSGQISVVVFIKSRLWEAVVKEQFFNDVEIAMADIPISTWKELNVECSGNMRVSGQSQISQEDVDIVDSSLMKLQERVEGMDYPPRVVLQTHNGADPSGPGKVKCFLGQKLILERTLAHETHSKHEVGNHEVELFRACFILGGLQSLNVGSGTYTLGPGNGLAKLIVPNEALSQNKELGIRYATLLDGPFYIPEGYYIVSSVLYIDYDTCLVNKPFELLLNHWYAGKDRQKTMTFLKASHVANKDGLFHFERFGRGLFSEEQQFGVLKLHDHLCLICCAVERTHQFYPPMTCRIVMLTKQVETDIVLFALYLTFDDAAWIKVINAYVVAKMGWSPGSNAPPQPISFKSHGSAGDSDGVEASAPFCSPHWVIEPEGCQSIKCSQMCEWLERYHTGTEQHCSRLRDEIESRLFPPCIQLRLTYAKDPTTWTSRQNVSLVVKRIMAPTEHIPFLLQVKVPDNDASKLESSDGGPPPITMREQCGSRKVSPPSVQTILKSHEEEFFECVNAKYNVLRLKRKEVISPSVRAAIDDTTEEEAKEILYDHLLSNATVDSLREWCEWAIAAQGYPKMQKLGRKMKDELA